MKLEDSKKLKFLKEIEKHRLLYQNKNLKYNKDKWIFYWMFLVNLVDTGYRTRTIENYYYGLRRFLCWINKESLNKINKYDIGNYLLHMKNDLHYVPYTIRYPKERISTFFSFVMRFFSKIKVNPSSNLDVRIHYTQKENMDLFTQEEIEMIVKKPLQVLSRLERENFKTEYSFRRCYYTIKMNYIILKLMFSTGIRPCEIVNIELDDFNQIELKIRIRSKGNQQYIMKDRHVYISNKTVSEINELIELQRNIRKEQSPKLLIHYNGLVLGGNYPNRVIKYWASICGIKRRVYAYMARYTYCTRIVENGGDIYSLKNLMGHKQVAITLKHYLKLTPAEIRKEWKKFNPLNQEGKV